MSAITTTVIPIILVLMGAFALLMSVLLLISRLTSPYDAASSITPALLAGMGSFFVTGSQAIPSALSGTVMVLAGSSTAASSDYYSVLRQPGLLSVEVFLVTWLVAALLPTRRHRHPYSYPSSSVAMRPTTTHTSTTAKPASTTAKPASTTAKPASTTAKPAVVHEPASVVAERLAKAWSAYVTRHEAVRTHVLDAETDWDTMFTLPALRDVSVPETASLARAMRVADSQDASQPVGLKETDNLTSYPYPSSVIDLETAWDRALKSAQRKGARYLPAKERRTLERIKQVIARIEDDSVGDAERAASYRALSGLVDELEQVDVAPSIRLAITDGSERLSRRLIGAPLATARA